MFHKNQPIHMFLNCDIILNFKTIQNGCSCKVKLTLTQFHLSNEMQYDTFNKISLQLPPPHYHRLFNYEPRIALGFFLTKTTSKTATVRTVIAITSIMRSWKNDLYEQTKFASLVPKNFLISVFCLFASPTLKI